MRNAGITPTTSYRFAEKSDIDALARVNTVNPAYQKDLDYRMGLDRKNEFFLIAERQTHSVHTKKQHSSVTKHDKEHSKKKIIVGMCNYYFHWYRPPRISTSSSCPTSTKYDTLDEKSNAAVQGQHPNEVMETKHSSKSKKKNEKRARNRKDPGPNQTNGRSRNPTRISRKIMYVATLQATKHNFSHKLSTDPSLNSSQSSACSTNKLNSKTLMKCNAPEVVYQNTSESRTGVALLCLAIQHARSFGCTTLFLDATSDSIAFYQRFFGMRRLPAREGYMYNPMVLYLDEQWDPGVPLGR